NPITPIERLLIARIATIGQSFAIQVCDYLLAGGGKKRTNNPVFTSVRHPPQPSDTCPPQQPHEHRFRLVIGGMTNRNAVSPYLMGELLHEGIARVTRRCLQ